MTGDPPTPSSWPFDARLHLAIARASHNRFLVKAIERIRLELHAVLTLLPESDVWHTASRGNTAASWQPSPLGTPGGPGG